MTSPEQMNNAAVKTLHNGIKLFPVEGIHNGYCTCGRKVNECTQKSGKVQAGKHPILKLGSWTRLSTNNPENLLAYLFEVPGRNLAFHAGANNAIITDFDDEEGCKAFEKLFAEHPEWFDTPAEKSGKGYHVLHRQTVEPVEAFNTVYGEVRTGDMYCVTAPSNHYSGAEYRALEGHALYEKPLLEMPGAFLAYLNSIRKSKPVNVEQTTIKPIIGNNHDRIFSKYDLPSWLVSQLKKGSTANDRSGALFHEACTLIAYSVDDADIYYLLEYSPNNKFNGRHDEQKRINATINEAKSSVGKKRQDRIQERKRALSSLKGAF